MLTQESMVTEFRPAAKQTEAGKVFPKLVKTAGGWHIIKVLKSQPMSFSDLPEDKKMLIRNQMAGEELEKKMTSWMEKKKSEAHIRRSDNMEKDAKSGI
jgi:parvulin-like peptidyl-prolyl isomerase